MKVHAPKLRAALWQHGESDSLSPQERLLQDTQSPAVLERLRLALVTERGATVVCFAAVLGVNVEAYLRGKETWTADELVRDMGQRLQLPPQLGGWNEYSTVSGGPRVTDL